MNIQKNNFFSPPGSLRPLARIASVPLRGKGRQQPGGYRKKYFFFHSQAGQTLIEAIIAVGVILVGIMSAVTLTVATISAARTSDFSVVAYNLAREGIEVARARRDSNWLERERGINRQWDDSLYNNTDYTATAEFNPTSNDWSFNYTPDDPTACLNNNTCRLYRDSNGLYTHNATGTASPFYRLVSLLPICQDGTVITQEGQRCGVTNPKVGVEVRSVVRWREKNRIDESRLIERIYNWRLGG